MATRDLDLEPLKSLLVDNETLCALNTLGNGSCFIHSIVAVTDSRYQSMSIPQKQALVVSHRKILGDYYSNIDNYNSLVDSEVRSAEIKEYNPKITTEVALNVSHAQYINYLKSNHTLSLQDCLILASAYKINIIIITTHADESYMPFDGFARTGIPYNPEYGSMIVIHTGGRDNGHFETVGINMPKSGYRCTYFHSKYIDNKDKLIPKSIDNIIKAYWRMG